MNNIGWSRKPENKGYALDGKWEMGRPNIALLMLVSWWESGWIWRVPYFRTSSCQPQGRHDMEKMTMAGTELRPCRPFKMRAAIWRGHGHFCTSPTLITLKVDIKISHPNGNYKKIAMWLLVIEHRSSLWTERDDQLAGGPIISGHWMYKVDKVPT